MANRLQYETSPYLLQHAENPVDWYPWGEEALEAAQDADKPIFLSIGYSACHWCHVMAHESFEDKATAKFMNEHFINIKVDREERPDLDDIYMQATLLFNRGQGGWPMSVFLTPDGRPFHAGTYFPPEPRYGMPSFRDVLEAVEGTFSKKRNEVEQAADNLTTELSRNIFESMANEPDLITVEILDNAAAQMVRGADPVHGGLTRGKPKFPNPVNLEFLLRYYHANRRTNYQANLHANQPGSQPVNRAGNLAANAGAAPVNGEASPQAAEADRALQVSLFSLRKMAQGGMYDHLGGGFHRYSVDELWLVPHFEKMLYDNALLARVYLHAWQVSGEALFREVAEETLDYVLREMTSPAGGFYSTLDADSEGVEGKFYVWTADEIRTALDGVVDDIDAVLEYWGVTPDGNFEGANILHVADMVERVAVRHGIPVERMREDINAAKMVLFTLRKERVAPGRDDKVLSGWNGMMLAALSEAARLLDREDYREAAQGNARFLVDAMIRDGGLLRTWKDGDARIAAYLEDYAHVIEGLLELYQTTFEARWFSEAQRLADVVMDHFRADDAGFYDTSDEHETLIIRPRNVQDNATPSGSAMAAYVLLRLTALTGETRFEEAALSVYYALGAALGDYPAAFGQMLIGVDLWLNRPVEIAVIGDPQHVRTEEMLAVIRGAYRPRAVVALAANDPDGKTVPALLRTRTLREGQPATYVCENFVCAAPVTSGEALEAVLDGAPLPPVGSAGPV